MKKIFTVSLLIIMVTIVFAKSPHGDDLKIDCAVCHVSDNWDRIKTDGFNHNATSFPLKGQHKTVSCKKCHQSLIFKDAKSTCNSCHLDIHQQTLGDDCGKCHTPNSWIVNNISQIHQQTNFPLIGTHAQIDCFSCHKSASLHLYEPMKSDCFDCHSNEYNQTTNPSHIASNFPKDCNLCHGQIDWNKATFNHNNTSFPLTGSHIGVDCNRCHSNGYAGISTECVSCHQKDYNAATNPNHIAAKFPTECNNCHNTTVWQPSTFNHNTNTSFPLSGGHLGVDCIKCHTSGYSNTSSECVSCHLKDYNATTDPNHTTAKFSTECTTCHNSTAWKPSTFNHNINTSFPLTGGHIGVDCIKCHASGYTGTSTECVSCHLKDYNATTDPNHTTAKFSTECTTCHNSTAWKPSTFNHNTNTSFPLTGGHLGVDCIKCHASGYTGTSTECVSCHLKDYNATTDPNHTTAKFSTECTTCHNSTAWKPSTFNHNTNTSFPLTGGHLGLDCIKCHASGYTGTSTECVSCHLKDYNATTDPNHTTAKFSTECTTCHNSTAWKPSTFNHNTNTSFPLTGGHIGVDCIKCHANGYTNTSTECVSCHLSNYNSTRNPAHAAAKFPTDCETCHNVTAWTPSTFNHDSQYFRIYSGKHRGEWTNCSECHTNASNFSIFSCIVCHEHSSKSSVDSDHRGVNGYVYSGTSCMNCHARI